MISLADGIGSSRCLIRGLLVVIVGIDDREQGALHVIQLCDQLVEASVHSEDSLANQALEKNDAFHDCAILLNVDRLIVRRVPFEADSAEHVACIWKFILGHPTRFLQYDIHFIFV